MTEQPPEPRRASRHALVVGDDQRVRTDAGATGCCGESVSRRQRMTAANVGRNREVRRAPCRGRGTPRRGCGPRGSARGPPEDRTGRSGSPRSESPHWQYVRVGIWSDDWDAGPEDDWSGGRASSKRLAPPGGMLGASVYELPPDGYSVYHFHHGSEELLIVLRGQPTLRTPDGGRQLDEGEAVYFPPGPEGAHGLTNHTSEPVRYPGGRHPPVPGGRRISRSRAGHRAVTRTVPGRRAAVRDPPARRPARRVKRRCDPAGAAANVALAMLLLFG